MIKIKLYADGANISEMAMLYRNRVVSGFTTNPSLMKKAGITDYTSFAKELLNEIEAPISFEVFSDTFDEMEREARIINSWGDDVYVKIPITNSKGESSIPLIEKLSKDGLSLNVTAILTVKQVYDTMLVKDANTPMIISVFAGRIADTGRDPMIIMHQCSKIVSHSSNAELLWASTRELLNIFQAEACGCNIITVTPDILKKLKLIGKDLTELSLETVQMFYNDALSVGYKL
jgi:transaldolase